MTLLVQVPEKTEEAQRMEEKFTPDSQYLVQAHDMKMYFPIKTGWFHSKPLKAVDGVSFDIRPGETLGLVGESGCGKTTVGRTLLRLYNPTGGEVYFDGKKVDAKSIGGLRKDMQMVFQDPYSSLNPRMTVEDIIGEPLDVHKLYTSRQDRRDKILHLMELVGLYNSVSSGMKMSLSAMDILSVLSQGYALMTSGADFVEYRIPQDGTYSYGQVGSSSVLDVRWKTNRTRFHALLDNEP